MNAAFKALAVSLSIFTIHLSPAMAEETASEFIGSYTSVSGQDGCYREFRMALGPNGDSLQILLPQRDATTGQVSYDLWKEYPSINMGWVPWKFEWGDGTATGEQITTVKDGVLSHQIVTGWLWPFRRWLTSTFELNKGTLHETETDTSTDTKECVYSKLQDPAP